MKDLSVPPGKPVDWIVRRNADGREAVVRAQTAFFALQMGSVALKDSAGSPCLDLDEMTARLA